MGNQIPSETDEKLTVINENIEDIHYLIEEAKGSEITNPDTISIMVRILNLIIFRMNLNLNCPYFKRTLLN